MAEILLSSEAFVKRVTSASDNLSGKYILPSLREAQEIGLRGILGDDLLAKLKALVKSETLKRSPVVSTRPWWIIANITWHT